MNRGGQLNIGDQVISVNGISMVGLPLSSCQAQIKVLIEFIKKSNTDFCFILEYETFNYRPFSCRSMSTSRRSTYTTTGYQIPSKYQT